MELYIHSMIRLDGAEMGKKYIFSQVMRIVKLVPDKAASIKAVMGLKPRVHPGFKQSTDPKRSLWLSTKPWRHSTCPQRVFWCPRLHVSKMVNIFREHNIHPYNGTFQQGADLPRTFVMHRIAPTAIVWRHQRVPTWDWTDITTAL